MHKVLSRRRSAVLSLTYSSATETVFPVLLSWPNTKAKLQASCPVVFARH